MLNGQPYKRTNRLRVFVRGKVDAVVRTLGASLAFKQTMPSKETPRGPLEDPEGIPADNQHQGAKSRNSNSSCNSVSLNKLADSPSLVGVLLSSDWPTQISVTRPRVQQRGLSSTQSIHARRRSAVRGRLPNTCIPTQVVLRNSNRQWRRTRKSCSYALSECAV